MIGVLVSGTGTNLQALLDAGLPVRAVASNRPGAAALARAEGAGIPAAAFPLEDFTDRGARDAAMADWLEGEGVELVVLAGYMHLLTPAFLDRFDDVVNVHPSLLPAFPGAHAVEDQLAAGVAESGATVHLVDEGIDTGPVLAQERVPVLPGDSAETLHERIRAVEHRLLPQGGGRAVRALISVYDKTGLDDFARGLAGLGFELVASGGTAAHLEELGVAVTRVEDVTAAPEMLGGRVKTLHPRIHAAILARRDDPEDMAALAAQGIEPFDLVCVTLYPFARAVAGFGVREEEAVEMIDVGGPSMLRAAAKNFAFTAAISRPDRYGFVLDELRDLGALSLETRRELAAETFATTAAYEATIAHWFAERETFPETIVPGFEKVLDLAYGENPHQRAAFYAEAGARRHLLSRVEQLQGKELSYNNLNDLSAGRLLVREFTVPACVIVKHANPCGVAVAATIEEAYERALASDPLSAYGGIVVLNRPVSAALAERLGAQFVEVLFAPGYDPEGLEHLQRKPALRVLDDRERRRGDPGERDFKRVLGGLLVQDRDWEVEDREGMVAVCGRPSETQWGDLLFAWRICKHVTSNSIVIVHDLRTVGIGAGQMSRVDSVRIALEKAAEHGHDLSGAALASDAFFPFPDGPQLALDAGVTGLIQPGGSKRDAEVVAAVERAGAAMIFTSRRHFRH